MDSDKGVSEHWKQTPKSPLTNCLGGHLGVSINWGTPNMNGFCNGKSHRSKWVMTGGSPMTKRTPPNHTSSIQSHPRFLRRLILQHYAVVETSASRMTWCFRCFGLRSSGWLQQWKSASLKLGCCFFLDLLRYRLGLLELRHAHWCESDLGWNLMFISSFAWA